MKKKLTMIAVMLAAVCALCACTSSKGYTFKGFADEKVNVNVVTDNGYDITKSGNDFDILKDEKVILRGSVVDSAVWEEFSEMAKSGEVELISDDGDKLVFKSEEKYDTIIMAAPNSYVILSGDFSEASEDEIKEAIDQVTCEQNMDE